MSVAGAFYGQDIAWLRQFQVELRNAISAASVAQSYTIAGRQVTRANLPELADTLQSVSQEINRQDDVLAGTPGANTASRVVYPDFSCAGASGL